MALIQVTASQLRTKAGELRDLNSQFKTQVNNLEGEEQVLAGMWEGEAKNVFHTTFNNNKGQMDNFYNLIEQYCMTLENIATQYENAESHNVEIAGQ